MTVHRFRNVGSTIAVPSYDHNTLYMHFVSEEKCTAAQNFSAHITFSCDAETLVSVGEMGFGVI